MESPNVIAYLFPVADQDAHSYQYALHTIKRSENSLRYVSEQREVDIELEIYSRESTVSLDDCIEDSTPEYLFKPGLQLTFNPGPKAGPGYVLGTDKNSCDIVLPKLPGISRRHCFLTFDEKRRLTLHDVSQNGTIVTYNGKAGEKRRDFKWILSGDMVPNDTEILLEFHSRLKFRIVVPKHQTSQDLYAKYVDRFLQDSTANTDLPIGRLGIQSASTTANQSGEHTPVRDPVYIPRGMLGRGAFSVVSRVWDVSTGNLYALKKFRNMQGSDWRKEADIMSQISHEHIIEFIRVIETPSPCLVLEFAPLGNLADQVQISDDEVITILCQSLNALTYLHSETIVHRDIKPENILVQSRNPIHIKLADFGLSKAASTLNTVCGTETYAAPEVFEGDYTESCDIWSLGVVIFEHVYGLPKRKGDKGRQWCQRILRALHNWDPDSLIEFLSDTMLIMDPKQRLPADECYMKAVWLMNQLQGLTQSPRPSQITSTSHTRLQDSNASTFVEIQNIPLQSLQPGTQSKDPTILGTLWSDHQQGDHTERNIIQDSGAASKRMRSSNGDANDGGMQRIVKRPAIRALSNELNQKNLVSKDCTYRCRLINWQIVRMRLRDRRICFTSYARAMKKGPLWIQEHLKRIDSRQKEEYTSLGFEGTLVDFGIMKSYARSWNIENSSDWRCLIGDCHDRQPLLSDVYLPIFVDDVLIPINTQSQTINITSIFTAVKGKERRTQLGRLLKSLEIQYDTINGGKLVQGTYIAQTDVPKFAEHIGVDLRSVIRRAEIWKNMTSASADVDHQGECLSQEIETQRNTSASADINHQGECLSQEIETQRNTSASADINHQGECLSQEIETQSTSADTHHHGKDLSREIETWETGVLGTSDVSYQEESLSRGLHDSISSSCNGITYPSDFDLMNFC